LEGDRHFSRRESDGVAFLRLDPATDFVNALLGRRLVRTDADAVARYFGILTRSEAEVHAQAHAHAADRPDADVLAVRVLRLVIAALNPVLRGKVDGGFAGIVEKHARFHHAVERLRLRTRLQQPGGAQTILRGLAPRGLGEFVRKRFTRMNSALGIGAQRP